MREDEKCFVDLVENRQYTIPKEAFVQVAIPEEDQKKINSWGDKEFWRSNSIEVFLGSSSVIILNKDLAFEKREPR